MFIKFKFIKICNQFKTILLTFEAQPLLQRRCNKTIKIRDLIALLKDADEDSPCVRDRTHILQFQFHRNYHNDRWEDREMEVDF